MRRIPNWRRGDRPLEPQGHITDRREDMAAANSASSAMPPPVASRIAWDLWSCARLSLAASERDFVAINLAAREFFDVIRFLLVSVVRGKVAIPTDLSDRLTRWSQTYVGHPDHAAIVNLVSRAIVASHRAGESRVPLRRFPAEQIQGGTPRASRWPGTATSP
jgi:hypothetical protein